MKNITRADIRNEIYYSLVRDMPAVCPNKDMVDGIIADVFSYIKKELMNNNRVELRGFGSFSSKVLKERYAKNPKTGEVVKVPARKKVYFKQGNELNNWGKYGCQD